ncbi:hypothetical protein RchiOBHm_Chr1g0348411 [Rosa chinensis]|uniref:Uncharacterized protein n=2 Tax=Rosa chinensis TaxID=74649 RepID=A0A2P6SFI2_ROSCH|nr:hypothetical protein RchiOBHm_Chr1g0348411 [Rosa chinensis]
MSFTVPAPLLPNQRIRGLNIFCVYANYDVDVRCIDPIIIRVNNKSKGLKWIYGPTCYGIPSSKDVVWLSHWKLGNRLEAGDEVTVTVFPFEPFQIKEWGFQVVHEQEGKISNQHNTTYPDDNDVIGKYCTDFSELYQVMPGTYFLCGGPMIYDRQSHVLQKGSVLFNHIIGDSDESAATKEAMRDRKNFCSRSGLVTITGAVSLICSPGRISKEGRKSQPKIKYTSLTQPKAPPLLVRTLFCLFLRLVQHIAVYFLIKKFFFSYQDHLSEQLGFTEIADDSCVVLPSSNRTGTT